MKITWQKDSNPYEAITDIIRKWCDKNYNDDFLVTIEIGYAEKEAYEITTILEYNGVFGFEWNVDWWEGQTFIELLGFSPISEIRISNIEYMMKHMEDDY